MGTTPAKELQAIPKAVPGMTFIAHGASRLELTSINALNRTKLVSTRSEPISPAASEAFQPEEILRRTADAFATVVEQAPLGIYIVDSKFRMRNVSAGAMPAFRSVQPLIGRDFGEVMRILWPESFASEAIRIFRHTLETGEPYLSPGLTEMRNDIGIIESYEWQINRVTLADGQYGVGCYFFDTTRLQQGQQTVRKSEERLRLAQHVANVGSFEWNIQENVGEWSPELEALYGFAPGGFSGRYETLAAMVHPGDLPGAERALREALETGVLDAEWRVVWPDGTIHCLAARGQVFKDSTGKLLRMIGVSLDITASKNAENALRDQLERAEFVANASDVGFWFCDLPFDKLIWDKRVKKHFWLAADAEVTIGRFYECLHPDDRDRTRKAIEESIRSRTRYDIEYRTVATDGSEKWIRAIGRTFYNEAGDATRFDGITMDVTESKRAAEALRTGEARYRELAENLESQVQARTLELEERNRDIVRMCESLSGLSNRLMRAQDDERRRLARDLHDSAGQLLTVINMELKSLAQELLKAAPQFSQRAEGTARLAQELQQEIRTTSYLLHPPLLDEVGLPVALAWYVEGFSLRSKIDTRLEIAQDFTRLPPDMELVIFRLVQESLTNIHRHSASRTALIRISKEGDAVEVEVQDQGRGIPPKKLATILSEGSGVGVRGMRERLRQLKGELKIESSDSGTRVWGTLPVLKFPTSHERKGIGPVDSSV